MRFPFDPKFITGTFGSLSETRKKLGLPPHSGLDFGVKEFEPIPAIGKGTVKINQFSKVLGFVLVHTVWGKDPETGKEGVFYAGYSHLAKASDLAIDSKIEEGQIIGKVGGGKNSPSGSASSGAHLHLTISKELKGIFGPIGAKMDPVAFIKANK